MNSADFVNLLAQVSLPDIFNPYRDQCSKHDHQNSAAIRCSNLARYLDTVVNAGIDSIWFGRDCGYRGCRRTGIALTDEMHLDTLSRHLSICGLAKATIGDPMKERTATYVWSILREVNARVFLWNIFPFHPFENGNPLTNRRHTSREFKECQHILIYIIKWIKPRRVFALGADAEIALRRLGLTVISVRHPSYGGHLEFARTIRDSYSSQCESRSTP